MSLRGCIGTPIVAVHLLLVPGRPTALSAQLAAAVDAPATAETGARSYDALFDELLRMSMTVGACSRRILKVIGAENAIA